MADLCRHGEENCVRCAMVDIKVPPIHVYFILDVSPSMAATWPQTLSGVNEYLDSLRNNEDVQYRVSLITFDRNVTTLYKDVVPDALPKFTNDNLKCSGSGTAVYDAVGSVIKGIDTTEPVLIVVFTDGEDNSSHIWGNGKLEVLTSEREKLGNYTLVYLGADRAAWGLEANFGVSHANSASFAGTADGRINAFRSLIRNSASYSGTIADQYKTAMASGIAPQSVCSVNNFFDDVAETVTPAGIPLVIPNDEENI